jgi:segregation and condensation protein A
MDLLLYLVRKHEVDVVAIPVAVVTEQYCAYVDILQQIEIDTVADFLDLASLLIEIKSKQLLPTPEEIDEPEIEDPREELVVRLLEFKKYRDAALRLDERGRQWQQHFVRRAAPSGEGASEGVRPIEGVELWDLVSAFGRVIRHKLVAPEVDTIRYDDTPIHVFMQQINARLVRGERVAFFDLFPAAVHKSTLVGMFLAVLELVRHRHALAEQAERFGEIFVVLGSEPLPADDSLATSVSAA